MAKVIREGNYVKEGPKNPPAGLKATCPRCGTEVETVEFETAIASRNKEGEVVGWTIRCPVCSSSIHLDKP